MSVCVSVCARSWELRGQRELEEFRAPYRRSPQRRRATALLGADSAPNAISALRWRRRWLSGSSPAPLRTPSSLAASWSGPSTSSMHERGVVYPMARATPDSLGATHTLKRIDTIVHQLSCTKSRATRTTTTSARFATRVATRHRGRGPTACICARGGRTSVPTAALWAPSPDVVGWLVLPEKEIRRDNNSSTFASRWRQMSCGSSRPPST